ncbi:MAG: tyrosine--tRNA ligase [Candidatus Kerfeldbacteria bacterium]|nr:tyrosine--tRNA ligase [Candidatus Kerfeldbacteria bacterium]
MANHHQQIKQLLTRGVEEIFIKKHLEARLSRGDKLRVKFGIDPTGPSIHIGRAATLWKLKEFQDLGHKLVVIIGDFTAQIGDPSDKLAKRPMLSAAQIEQNLVSYKQQLGRILDTKKVEWRHNQEWLNKMDLQRLAQLAESFSVQQMLARRNFKERWQKGSDISLRELLYPLLQGYDSVMVKADVELGGFDQLFNLQAGRVIQPLYKQPPQDIMVTQMLTGTDGRKMSTSWGNVIAITDEPAAMYGKAMSVKDELIGQYLLLAARLDTGQAEELLKKLKQGANPRDIKKVLAFELVKLYHGARAAVLAAADFTSIHEQNKLPAKMVAQKISRLRPGQTIVELLVYLKLTDSKAAARRLVEQKGVKLNQVAVKDWRIKPVIKTGDVIQVGNRKFIKII